jgi:hypothetical protein
MFHRKFPESVVPPKATVYRTVAKFCATESVLDKKKIQKRHILNKEMLHNTVIQSEASLK